MSVPEAIYRHGSGSGIQSDAYSGIVFRKLPLAGEMLAILFQGHMSMLNVYENHIFSYISVSYKLPIICTCPFHIFVIFYTFAFINFFNTHNRYCKICPDAMSLSHIKSFYHHEHNIITRRGKYTNYSP